MKSILNLLNEENTLVSEYNDAETNTMNSVKEEKKMKAIEINNVGSVKEEKTMMSFAEFKDARCAGCGFNSGEDKCDDGYCCEGILQDFLVYHGTSVVKAIKEEEKNMKSFDEFVAVVCNRCNHAEPMYECIDCPLSKMVQTNIMEKESMKSYLERLYKDEPEKAAVLSRIRWTPAGDIVHTLYNESQLVYLYNKYLAYARFYEHKLDLINKDMIKYDYKNEMIADCKDQMIAEYKAQMIADCKDCIADWSKETKSKFFAINKLRLAVPKGSEEKKKELIEECIAQNEKLLKHYLTKEEIEILEIDKMNPIKEEKNMNFIKEEKKMKTYAELKDEKAKKREAKIEKVLAKGTEVYKYPIAIKNRSREQEPVYLKDLRALYNLSYEAESNSEFNRLLYRLKHGAALIDDNNNVIYQEDEGYYACMLTSERRYRSAAQHLVPKCNSQHDAVGVVIDYCNSMNTYYTGKFLNTIYRKVCGIGLVNYKDEGFGSVKQLQEAAAKFTFADKATLEEFDVKAPKVKIFNGYLVNHTPFIEVTTCSENTDETYSISYTVVPAPKTPAERAILENASSRDITHGIFSPLRTYDAAHKYHVVQAPKRFSKKGAHFAINDAYAKKEGYFTSAISTANYRSYAPKDEGLSYYAILEGGKTKQADYDDYLDHSEMGMYDKGITHTLADAWRDFAATLSDEDKKFFGVDDKPQGMTEYDPEQEGFAFPYSGHETALTDALDGYEEAVKFNKALSSAIVRPKF